MLCNAASSTPVVCAYRNPLGNGIFTNLLIELWHSGAESGGSLGGQEAHASLYAYVSAPVAECLFRYGRVRRGLDVEWRRNRSWPAECSGGDIGFNCSLTPLLALEAP